MNGVHTEAPDDFALAKSSEKYTVGELMDILFRTCAYVEDMRKDIKELKEEIKLLHGWRSGSENCPVNKL